MKERPILFSVQMVRAILEGRKTQTRRVVKPGVEPAKHWNYQDWCPYGIAGDRLWVKESLTLWPGTTADYSADGEIVDNPFNQGYTERQNWLDNYQRATVPSIHCPRWASRITLEICSVRVERLKEISEDDAQAEGVGKEFRYSVKVGKLGENERIPLSHRGGFENLWNRVNSKREGCSWADNPFVWVIEFRRL